ncbi:hypothetical protein SY27_16935 [Flavobacterium sp. 316]|uniref:PD40 domain-containing protein n=1 Tax=Flavobacterium sp. 316 TaxID=1603293 RepID=UPI0005DF7C9C|nr:PD40 domain-containing protein [Flavobacterium sp. 316]KIX19745.1 hypothetical protein SY27_16935 [Flavobacterium sp. 316]
MYKQLLFISIITLNSLFVSSQNEVKPTNAFDFLSKYQNVRDISISKNHNEVYFTIQSNDEQVSKIAFVTKKNKKWSKPKLVSFSSAHRDIEPFLSGDGLRLYFSSNRPLHDSISKSKDYDIWYVERKSIKDNWSKAINIGAPINSEKDEFYPSVSINKNVYFTVENSKTIGKEDIFVSKWQDNTYSEPENLGTNVNSDGYEFNAFISPNEDFLIYSCYKRDDGFGSGDLYISYRNESGNWEKAKNLGNEINSPALDYCPFYDSQNKMLYFTSKKNIKSSNVLFNTIEEFEEEITKTENGNSRIYKYNIQL